MPSDAKEVRNAIDKRLMEALVGGSSPAHTSLRPVSSVGATRNTVWKLPSQIRTVLVALVIVMVIVAAAAVGIVAVAVVVRRRLARCR
jgi:hypothetical protein